jgi:hypothetical protein
VFAVGEREGDEANTFQLPGYARVDLLAAYEWKLEKSRLTAQLNVENLLDKEYFLSSRTRSDVLPGAPRTFLGSIRIEFCGGERLPCSNGPCIQVRSLPLQQHLGGREAIGRSKIKVRAQPARRTWMTIRPSAKSACP